MRLDYTYILVLIGAIISAIASANVNSTYKKYSKVFASSGLKAEEVAARILRGADITDVKIDRVSGNLTDHYSPNEKVLRLSDSVYGSSSVAAIGVAAHECGHAVQHNVGYAPIKLRSAAVPIANIGSKLAWPVIIAGLVLGLGGLAKIGVFLFLFVVLFQLITLPVELDASRRALKIIESEAMLVGDENSAAGKVLKAAALTYVAALFSTVLQFFRLFMIAKGSGGRRR